MAGTLIRTFLNAEHLGFEALPERAKKVFQCRTVGAFPGSATRCAHLVEFREIRFSRSDRFLVWAGHRAFLRVGCAVVS